MARVKLRESAITVKLESTLTAKYQTTIPAAVRTALNLGTSDRISFEVFDEGVLLKKAELPQELEHVDESLGPFLELIATDLRNRPGSIVEYADDDAEEDLAMLRRFRKSAVQ